MNRSLVAAALAALAFGAASVGWTRTAEAGTIEFTIDTDNYTGSYGGGEFAVASYSDSYASMGSGVRVSPWLYQTFCLEVSEQMQFGRTLNFSAGTSAVGGGGGATNGSDPLGAATAYLYTQFYNGTLSGYDYTQGSGRTADATSLQLAIWKLEGEVDGNSTLEGHYANNSQAQSWVSAANSAVSNGSWSGLGSVVVLNVTDSRGSNLQSVLAVTAIPLPPAALLGLGLMTGVGGFGLLRRRRNALV